MFLEIHQIKKYLAEKYNFLLENPDNQFTSRVVGEVPDGKHVIPIGRTETPTHVEIKGGNIHIGETAKEGD